MSFKIGDRVRVLRTFLHHGKPRPEMGDAGEMGEVVGFSPEGDAYVAGIGDKARPYPRRPIYLDLMPGENRRVYGRTESKVTP